MSRALPQHVRTGHQARQLHSVLDGRPMHAHPLASQRVVGERHGSARVP